MTKKQALNYLKSSGFSKEQIEAVVDALQEPTTKNDLGVDCKSRKAALDACHKFAIGVLDDYYEECLKRWIIDLPSVTPIRPKGHWIKATDKTGRLVCECDKCGWQQKLYTNFCPCCSADMREVVEE